jgi:hypothetical protein
MTSPGRRLTPGQFREVLMVDNLETVLQAVMTAQQVVTVYLNQLTRSGKIIRVGQDYLVIQDDAGPTHLIPFNAITLMEAVMR